MATPGVESFYTDSMERSSSRTVTNGGMSRMTRSHGSMGLADAVRSRSPSRPRDTVPLPHSSSTTSDNFVLVDNPNPSTLLKRISKTVLSDGGAEADGESAVEMARMPSGASSQPPRETYTVRRSRDPEGLRKINQYVRLGMVGAGSHGHVWLCRDTTMQAGDPEEFWALKEVMREGTKQDQHTKGLRANKHRVNLMHSSHRSHRSGDDAPSLSLSPSSSHEMDQKVRTEIAVMKRCNHKHIVRLREVINDSRVKKVFFILEYMSGGQVIWQDPTVSPPVPTLTVAEARSVFRDLVLGLEYLHHQGIIHRDIKPANLLWETRERKVVKISDFGVSVVMQHTLPPPSPSGTVRPRSPTYDESSALRSSNGTFAFFAPELCTTGTTPGTTPMPRNIGRNDSYGMYMSESRDPVSDEEEEVGETTLQAPASSSSNSGRRIISHPLDSDSSRNLPVGYSIDIWAAGVTLYCLLFGTVPFTSDGQSGFSFFGIIPSQSIEVPPFMGADHVSTENAPVIDLLDRLLVKDPRQRATLAEVKRHPWLLQDLDIDSGDWLRQTAVTEESRVVVSQDDVAQATATRTNRAKPNGGRVLAMSIKRAMDRFGVFGRSSASLPPEGETDHVVSVQPLSPRSSSLLSSSGRARAHSSAAVSSSSASVPLSPVTPAESSPSMQRTVSGSSAGSHSPAIVRVPSQALRRGGGDAHLHPPRGRQQPSSSDRASESEVILSSPASKSSGAFKALISRMRSSSRVTRPSAELTRAALDEHAIMAADAEPPTPRTFEVVGAAPPAAYSSRALRPIIQPITQTYSSDDYDDSDEADGEEGEPELELHIASPASLAPNSRFVPPASSHHQYSDADGDAEDDESDEDEGNDSLAMRTSRRPL